MNGIVIFELKVSHCLENLAKVWTYISHFLSLGKDLKELIIGQEIETSEVRTLLLEIISKTLLNNFEILVCLLELFFETFF